jgi:DNA polymerase delta subunit 1
VGLYSSKRIKNADLQCFDNEKDLLLAWRDAIMDLDPDFIMSFNGFNFDNRYVQENETTWY